MMKLAVALAVVPMAFLMSTSMATATVTYTYQGLNYCSRCIRDSDPPPGTYTTSMSISGSIELANPLPANLPPTIITGEVLSHTFTDGRNRLTEADTHPRYDFLLAVGTDAAGNITTWYLQRSSLRGSTVPGFMLQTILLLSDSTARLGFGDDSARMEECSSLTVPCHDGVAVDLAWIPGRGTWTFVPEPTTALLLGLGLIGIAATRRRVPSA
jgi:hypothetical protein